MLFAKKKKEENRKKHHFNFKLFFLFVSTVKSIFEIYWRHETKKKKDESSASWGKEFCFLS